jgi:hypothetical protein
VITNSESIRGLLLPTCFPHVYSWLYTSRSCVCTRCRPTTIVLLAAITTTTTTAMSAASTRLKSLVSPAPFPSAASPSTKEEADKQQLAPQDRSSDGFLLPKTSQLEMLKGAVPLSSCEDCSVGGEGGEEEYDGPMLPSKFEVDLECEMLGSGSEFDLSLLYRCRLVAR